jgi:hypothetical protein
MGWFHDDVFYFFGVEMIYNFLSLNFLLEMSLNNQFCSPLWTQRSHPNNASCPTHFLTKLREGGWQITYCRLTLKDIPSTVTLCFSYFFITSIKGDKNSSKHGGFEGLESFILVILPNTGKTFVFEERYKGAP